MNSQIPLPSFPPRHFAERPKTQNGSAKYHLKKLLVFFVWLLAIAHSPLAFAVDSCSANPAALSFNSISGSQTVFLTCSCDNSAITGVPGEVKLTSFSPVVVNAIPLLNTFTAAPTQTFVVPLSPGMTVLNFEWRCPNATATDYQTAGSISVAVTIQTPPPQPTPMGGSGANLDLSVDALDPVNTFTGELFNFYAPDITRGGPMSLAFSRYYASSLKANNITGSMGDNWRHRFEWSMTSTATSATIVNHLGRTIDFNKTAGVWNLDGKLDIAFQLLESAGTFTLLDPRSGRRYLFNASGRLTSIQDGKGNQHSLVYNASNQLTQVSDGLGRTLNLTYNAGGQLTGVVGDGGQSIAFTYLGDSLVSSSDALNNTTTYAYTATGLMTGSTRPEGNTPYTQTWNASNKVANQTDALANTTQLDYTATDTTITDPLSNTRVHTYSAGGEITDNQDETAQSFGMGYNGDGRRSSVTDRFGDTTSFSYDAVSGALASITNADGTTITSVFSTRIQNGFTLRDISSTTYPDGSSESYTYASAGNLLSRTLRDGNQWTFTYNNRGQVLTTTNPLGGVSTRTYNADGTLNSRTDAAGNTITYTYDGLRRLVVRTYPDTTTMQYSYDANNHLLTRTNALGQVTSFTYDGNKNLTTLTDPLGNSASLTPDALDRLSTITDALGNSSSRSYDALQRLNSVTDRNGNTSTLGYDMQGRLTTLTDGLGNVWNRTFDAESILASVSDPLNNTYTFTSNNMGRITQSTTPLGNARDISYDAMGRVIATQNPLGESTAFAYDANSRSAGVTLPGGAIATVYSRNALGQLIQASDPDGNNWLRSFDNQGRKTGSRDPLGNAVMISYDNHSRPSVVTLPGGLGTATVAYDDVGRAVNRSYSDGTNLTYTYDANGRLTTASGITNSFDANGRVINSNGIAITYDAGGRTTSMILAPDKTVTYSYDANNRLTRVSDWLGGVSNFNYDAAGRLTSMTRSNGITTSYTWDNDSNLISITQGGLSSITLNRDVNRQITSATRNVPLTASSTGLSNTVSAYDAAAQSASGTYDAMGRLTGAGGNTYTWDLASRLTTYTRSGSTVSANYDAGGLRQSRTVNGQTRNYTWNYALGLPSVSIVKQGAADLNYYIHTPGGALLYRIAANNNARTFYHYDEMGNTSFVSNDAGNTIASYAYGPYGEVLASTGSLDNPFTWQGQYGVMDEGNGLYYLRARFYDSTNGRFISRDPVNFVGPRGINPYQYAYNNPLRYVDRTGLEPESQLSQADLSDLGVALSLIAKHGILGAAAFGAALVDSDERERERKFDTELLDEQIREETDRIDRALFEAGRLLPCEIDKLREAVAKALKKFRNAEKELKEDTEFLTDLDLLEFGEAEVRELRDKFLEASDALDRGRGIDPDAFRGAKTEVQGVICLA